MDCVAIAHGILSLIEHFYTIGKYSIYPYILVVNLWVVSFGPVIVNLLGVKK
jgi:hypothetical protein